VVPTREAAGAPAPAAPPEHGQEIGQRGAAPSPFTRSADRLDAACESRRFRRHGARRGWQPPRVEIDARGERLRRALTRQASGEPRLELELAEPADVGDIWSRRAASSVASLKACKPSAACR
jgi:hypothetical protein